MGQGVTLIKQFGNPTLSSLIVTGPTNLSGSFAVSGSFIVSGSTTTSGNINANGSVSATSFTGPGTGLTGTASSLNIGGTSSNITAYTINQSVGSSNSPTFAALTINGAITATGDITAYYSDMRLKTNIRTIDSALNKLMQLGGYYYNPNDLAIELGASKDRDERVGLMAQEVMEVLPHAIKDAPFDKTGTYKTVQYDKLVPLLIQAIKEQQSQIEELKLRL
jgi:hypothetical protein